MMLYLTFQHSSSFDDFFYEVVMSFQPGPQGANNEKHQYKPTLQKHK